MEPIHNNLQPFSRRPRLDPIHYQVPIASRNTDRNPIAHNEMAPIPSCNPTSMSIRHQSGSNDPASNTAQNRVRHQESIHNPTEDNSPILHKGLVDRRKPGNLY